MGHSLSKPGHRQPMIGRNNHQASTTVSERNQKHMVSLKLSTPRTQTQQTEADDIPDAPGAFSFRPAMRENTCLECRYSPLQKPCTRTLDMQMLRSLDTLRSLLQAQQSTPKPHSKGLILPFFWPGTLPWKSLPPGSFKALPRCLLIVRIILTAIVFPGSEDPRSWGITPEAVAVVPELCT